MPTTRITKNKFRLSKNANATEVVLLCHGSWTVANGYTLVPSGMTVNFYSAHGQFGTQSNNIAMQLFGESSDAPLPPSEIAKLQGLGSREFDAALLAAKARINATTDPLSMIVDSVGGGALRAQVYDYTLGYFGPRDSEAELERIWDQHRQGAYSPNVDLIVMEKNTSRQRRLSDAIAFAMSKGNYAAFHYLPCRHVAASDTEAMRSVSLPEMTGDVIQSGITF